jgi:hypothetical protein
MPLKPQPLQFDNPADPRQPDGRAQPSGRDAIGSGAIAGAMRDAAVRATTAVGVGAIAVIHAVDSVGK